MYLDPVCSASNRLVQPINLVIPIGPGQRLRGSFDAQRPQSLFGKRAN